MTTKEEQKKSDNSEERKDTLTKSNTSSQKKFVSSKNGFKGKKEKEEKKDEFEQRILDIARVTRVMSGGKRMSFRATVAIGDKNGRIGIGVNKGAGVSIAVTKAVNNAKKDLVNVPITNDTIPHEIKKKVGAAEIFFKPAPAGSGVIAGGIVRIILDLAGIKNISGKILGTNNRMNNARCTLEALRSLRKIKKEENGDQEGKNRKKSDFSKTKEKKNE